MILTLKEYWSGDAHHAEQPLLLQPCKSDDGAIECQPETAIQLICTLAHSHNYGPSNKNNIEVD